MHADRQHRVTATDLETHTDINTNIAIRVKQKLLVFTIIVMQKTIAGNTQTIIASKRFELMKMIFVDESLALFSFRMFLLSSSQSVTL